MKNSDLFSNQIHEIYNISPLDNIESILQNGLLSFNNAKRIFHVSLANDEIQLMRANKVISKDGLTLHDYASCYFNPRNAMLYRLISNGENCVIISISIDVLNLTDTLITDRNAATQISRIYTPADGYEKLNFEVIKSKLWVNQNGESNSNVKEQMQAEILVKERISPEYFNKIYVKTYKEKNKLDEICSKYNIIVEVNRDLFFNMSN